MKQKHYRIYFNGFLDVVRRKELTEQDTLELIQDDLPEGWRMYDIEHEEIERESND